MNDIYKILQQNSEVIILGVDIATEPLIRFCLQNKKNIEYIAVEKMTIAPNKCAVIPSRRLGGTNSFSETDMLMDSEIHGIPVRRVDLIPEAKRHSLFLIASEQCYHDNVHAIRHLGFTNLMYINEELLQAICNEVFSVYDLYQEYWNLQQICVNEIQLLRNCLRRQLKPTPYDFHFEFHLVEHCNLKCRSCTHFSPLAEEEFLEPEEFKRDIARLSELTNKRARFINLLGGEPLLHPRAETFGEIAREYFPNATIRIVTNGILIPDMSEQFWFVCRNNAIEVCVTEYPIDVDYEQRRKIVEDHQVTYVSFSGSGTRDEMWKLALNENGKNRPVDNFMRCPRPNACVFCAHGKVFTCATMANICHFNNYFGKQLVLEQDDYVDIYKIQTAEEIFEYLSNPTPFCRYCEIESRQYGLKWKTSEYALEEWT